MNEMALASITSSCNFVQAPELVLSQAALDLAEAFDPLDANAMKHFGIAIVSKMTELTLQFAPRHQAEEFSEAVAVLQAMVDVVETSELDQLCQPSIFSKLPFIGDRFAPLKLCAHQFDVLKTQLDVLSYRLQKYLFKLGHELKQMDRLSRNCEKLLLQLEVHIEAGQFRLAQLNHTVLPQLQEQAQKSGHIIDSQHYQEASQAVMQLDERICHLMMARLAVLNIAPQIHFSQQGNQTLLDGIQNIVCDSLPTWQMEFVNVIENKDKVSALEVFRAVTRSIHQALSNMLMHAKTNTVKREQAQPHITHLCHELNLALSQTLAELN